MAERIDRAAPKMSLELVRVLDGVRARVFWLEFCKWGLAVLMYLLVMWWVRVEVDEKVDLPWGMRAGLLGLDGVVVGWMTWRWVLWPWKNYLSRKQAAQLMERRLPELGLRTGLVAAVELTDESVGEVPAREGWLLVEALVAEVEAKVKGVDWAKRLFDGKQVKWMGGVTLLVLLAVAGKMVGNWPMSGLLLQRVWLVEVSLPEKTKVVSMTRGQQVMAGELVRLSARVEGEVPEVGKLRLRYEGGNEEVMEVRGVKDEAREFVGLLRNVRESLKYRFELNGAVGEEHWVKVEVPPVLQEMRMVQRYPDYTGLSEERMLVTGLKLLTGSKLMMEGVASEALAGAKLRIEDGQGKLVKEEVMQVVGEGRDRVQLGLEVPREGWAKMMVTLQSERDVASVNDAVYRVTLLRDEAPQVEMVEPKEERLSLLANDRLPLVVRVRDDFGLSEVALCYRVFRAGLEGVNERVEQGRVMVEVKRGEKVWLQQMDWELGEISPALTAGCRVSFWVEATDNNALSGPMIGRSEERTIEILTERQERLELESVTAGGSQGEGVDSSMILKLRSGEREALELLREEGVSPDYEAMVRQYIRNLGDGQLPVK